MRQSNSKRPESWATIRDSARYRLLIPLLFLDWISEWAAYLLGSLSLLDLLQYCGAFSILLAVIFYFMDAPERMKEKHYQAWQVINTAQGKGGSGGRVDALQDLNFDHVPLVGVDLSDAFLQNIQLPGANLIRSRLARADLRGARLAGIQLQESDLTGANLRNADLSGADCSGVRAADVDFYRANLQNAQVGGVDFDNADLREANLSNLGDWKGIQSMKSANVHGVIGAPDGFLDWALSHGAVDSAPHE